jgi:hypothetical protein
MIAKINTYKSVTGKPEGERPLSRPRSIYEDNIKIISKKHHGRCELD